MTMTDHSLSHSYAVRLRPGCYSSGRGLAPVISWHETLRGAVRAAYQSDRLMVTSAADDRCIWRISARPSPHGHGLHGTGPRKGDPSLDECIAAALEAEEAD